MLHFERPLTIVVTVLFISIQVGVFHARITIKALLIDQSCQRAGTIRIDIEAMLIAVGHGNGEDATNRRNNRQRIVAGGEIVVFNGVGNARVQAHPVQVEANLYR